MPAGDYLKGKYSKRTKTVMRLLREGHLSQTQDRQESRSQQAKRVDDQQKLSEGSAFSLTCIGVVSVGARRFPALRRVIIGIAKAPRSPDWRSRFPSSHPKPSPRRSRSRPPSPTGPRNWSQEWPKLPARRVRRKTSSGTGHRRQPWERAATSG